MYFYPMDDTPGCTKQACSLRDHNAEIAARGGDPGVSTQDEASHRKFTASTGSTSRCSPTRTAPWAGLRDDRRRRALSAARALAGMADRVTFIIDEKGRIAHVIDRPDVANHAEEVLALL